jgi:hypothetical protein
MPSRMRDKHGPGITAGRIPCSHWGPVVRPPAVSHLRPLWTLTHSYGR